MNPEMNTASILKKIKTCVLTREAIVLQVGNTILQQFCK